MVHNFFIKKFSISVLISTLLLAAGCSTSAPYRIDPTGDQKVTSMQVDYAGIVEWATTLTNRMLKSGFLDKYARPDKPVIMVVSNIENLTNMTNFPTQMVMGRIRAALSNSGKVRWVSTYGPGATDKMPMKTDKLPVDPRFENPDWIENKKFKVARLSLRTQLLYRAARTEDASQNTYEMRMFITDNATGIIVWEGFSKPIAKKTESTFLGF